MTQPQRLLDDPGTSALARTLLASSEGDGPSDGSRSSIAKRLGIGAAVLASGTNAGAVATIWKIGLVLLALGGITIAVVAVRGDEREVTTPPKHVIEQPAPVVVETPPAPIEAPAVVEAPTVVVEAPSTIAPPSPTHAQKPVPRVAQTKVPERPPVEPPRVEPRPVEPPAPVESPPAVVEPVREPAPAMIDPRLLAAEVAVLDRARGALRSGDIAAALAALDEHDRDFAVGSLRAEADVVRIETLIKLPDHSAARARANTFITTYPRSPLVKRVRSLIDRLPAKTQEAP